MLDELFIFALLIAIVIVVLPDRVPDSDAFPLAAVGLGTILISALPLPAVIPLPWRTRLRQCSLATLGIAFVFAATAGANGYTNGQNASDEIERGEPASLDIVNLPLSAAVCLTPAKDAAPLPLPASSTLMGTATNGTYFFWAEQPGAGWSLYRVPSDSVTVRTRSSFDAKC